MSEENPVFKVTDRRLFNADGSPREIEEASKTETKKAEPAPAAEAQPKADSTPSTERVDAGPAERAAPTDEEQASESELSSSGPDSTESVSGENDAQPEIPGADDPASFINFLMSIASNAAASLGMMEHPVTGERSLDIELGKHWIDVLGMLEKKTRGNLSPQEHQIFEGLLADLRMQYVSLNSSPQPKSPRSFSGSDIIGGK